MDITAISGISDTHTANIERYPENGAVNCKLLDLFGRKTDALSAVKLDPAVLEAQVTVTNPQNAQPHTEIDSTQNVRSLVPKKAYQSQSHLEFKKMVMKQEAALLSLTPQQMDLLMKFTETMRQQRLTTQKQLECSFCKNNREAVWWYSSHCLKDSRGHVKCPVLRSFRCHLCGATGDRAHTIKYCPENILLDADYWGR